MSKMGQEPSLNRTIAIVGTNHAIQHGGHMTDLKRDRVAQFQKYLAQLAHDEHATLLAEEFSEYALALSSTQVSTVRDVATRVGCDHLFVDPEPTVRQELGISTDAEREIFWL